jgi:hypothetical protein
VMRSVIEYSRQRPPRHFPREAPNAGIAVRHNRLPRPLPASWPHSIPLTVFDCQAISAARRERIEAAVEAGGAHVAQPYAAWNAADPSRGVGRVLITGPPGFERTVASAADEAPERTARSAGCRRMACHPADGALLREGRELMRRIRICRQPTRAEGSRGPAGFRNLTALR